MKKICCLLIAVALMTGAAGQAHSQDDGEVLFQVSTVEALLDGLYDGEITYKELKKRGDFGIGTFNGLDGEMVGFDGAFYQVKADGTVHPAGDKDKTPFAAVTFFEPDMGVYLTEQADYEQLGQFLDRLLPTTNVFYAIQIKGVFEYIKTRSVPRQTKPYPPASEVMKDQPIFEFHNVEGVIAGFRCPPFMGRLNVPGYHLHFLAKDLKGGGHILECRLKDVKIEVDETNSFLMVLPQSSEFYAMDLTREKRNLLKREQGE